MNSNDVEFIGSLALENISWLDKAWGFFEKNSFEPISANEELLKATGCVDLAALSKFLKNHTTELFKQRLVQNVWATPNGNLNRFSIHFPYNKLCFGNRWNPYIFLSAQNLPGNVVISDGRIGGWLLLIEPATEFDMVSRCSIDKSTKLEGKLSESELLSESITDKKRNLVELEKYDSQLVVKVEKAGLSEYEDEECEIWLAGKKATIAQEIHDGLGQEITVLRLGLAAHLKETLSRNLDCPTYNIAEQESAVRGLILQADRVLSVSRSIMIELKAGSQALQDLSGGLNNLTIEFAKQLNIDGVFTTELLGNTRIYFRVAPTLFRCTQELLSNMAKHSQATKFSVKISTVDNICILNVADNGLGFSEKSLRGLGTEEPTLQALRQRVNDLNGIIKICTRPDFSGSSVSVLLPLFPDKHLTGEDLINYPGIKADSWVTMARPADIPRL